MVQSNVQMFKCCAAEILFESRWIVIRSKRLIWLGVLNSNLLFIPVVHFLLLLSRPSRESWAQPYVHLQNKYPFIKAFASKIVLFTLMDSIVSTWGLSAHKIGFCCFFWLVCVSQKLIEWNVQFIDIVQKNEQFYRQRKHLKNSHIQFHQ